MNLPKAIEIRLACCRPENQWMACRAEISLQYTTINDSLDTFWQRNRHDRMNRKYARYVTTNFNCNISFSNFFCKLHHGSRYALTRHHGIRCASCCIEKIRIIYVVTLPCVCGLHRGHWVTQKDDAIWDTTYKDIQSFPFWFLFVIVVFVTPGL